MELSAVPAGRRLNDSMGAYVASQLVKQMIKRRIHVEGARVLVLGLAFKENCPDLRNTRVVDIVAELRDYGALVEVFDPQVNKQEAEQEYDILPVEQPEPGGYDAILLAVAHREFRELGAERVRAWGKPGHVLYDLKYTFPKADVDLRL